MKWYQYLTTFLAGLFLMNAIPHFLHGIFGYSFPTPFSEPPGKGLSDPQVNLFWSFANIIIGLLFYKLSAFRRESKVQWGIFIIGMIVMSLILCYTLPQKTLT